MKHLYCACGSRYGLYIFQTQQLSLATLWPFLRAVLHIATRTTNCLYAAYSGTVCFSPLGLEDQPLCGYHSISIWRRHVGRPPARYRHFHMWQRWKHRSRDASPGTSFPHLWAFLCPSGRHTEWGVTCNRRTLAEERLRMPSGEYQNIRLWVTWQAELQHLKWLFQAQSSNAGLLESNRSSTWLPVDRFSERSFIVLLGDLCVYGTCQVNIHTHTENHLIIYTQTETKSSTYWYLLVLMMSKPKLLDWCVWLWRVLIIRASNALNVELQHAKQRIIMLSMHTTVHGR